MNFLFIILCFFLHSTVSLSHSNKHNNGLCPNGWLYKANSCYLGVDLELNFDDAVDFCKKHDSSLLQTKNQHKIDLIKPLFKTTEIITWIGLYENKENRWLWLDNSTFNEATSPSWCFGQKNANYMNMCAGIYLEDDGCLLNWPCQIPMPFGFVCEYNLKKDDSFNMLAKKADQMKTMERNERYLNWLLGGHLYNILAELEYLNNNDDSYVKSPSDMMNSISRVKTYFIDEEDIFPKSEKKYLKRKNFDSKKGYKYNVSRPKRLLESLMPKKPVYIEILERIARNKDLSQKPYDKKVYQNFFDENRIALTPKKMFSTRKE